MAVTYRLRKQVVPYRTRLTGRLISCNEGFDANASDPSPIWATVIPGRAQHEPGIHPAAEPVDEWIPGSRFASPGMTAESYATISFSTPISASGAVTFGA